MYLIAVFILYRYSEDPDSTDESKVVNVSNDYSSDTLDSKVFYPAMTAFTDQYSLPNIFFDIGQL